MAGAGARDERVASVVPWPRTSSSRRLLQISLVVDPLSFPRSCSPPSQSSLSRLCDTMASNTGFEDYFDVPGGDGFTEVTDLFIAGAQGMSDAIGIVPA